jgi:hypothetical protein
VQSLGDEVGGCVCEGCYKGIRISVRGKLRMSWELLDDFICGCRVTACACCRQDRA